MDNNIQFGFLETLRVHHVLSICRQSLSCAGSVVVRGLDSTRDIEKLTAILQRHRIDGHIVHGNTVMPPEQLDTCLALGLFTGFDELWFFEALPPEFSLEILPPATSDAVTFANRIPDGFREAMLRTGCFLVLADGCGLNYVTTNVHILSQVLGLLAEEGGEPKAWRQGHEGQKR